MLPHRTSTFGPGLAVGDINNDGKEDLFIGAAATHTPGLYIQTEDGFKLQGNSDLEKDKANEDLGATLFDADADRALFIDEKGRTVDADVMGMIIVVTVEIHGTRRE